MTMFKVESDIPKNLERLIKLATIDDLSMSSEPKIIAFNRVNSFDIPIFDGEKIGDVLHDFYFNLYTNCFEYKDNTFLLKDNAIVQNKIFVLKQEFLLKNVLINYIDDNTVYHQVVDKGDCKFHDMLVLNHYEIKNSLALIPLLEVFYNSEERKIEVVQIKDGFYRTYYNFYLTSKVLIDKLESFK